MIRDEPVPFDNNRLFFLSVFRNKNRDIEKASDSHYELSNSGMKRLENYLIDKYRKQDLIDGLKEFFRTNNESDLTNLFDSLEIDYNQYHFDDYD